MGASKSSGLEGGVSKSAALEDYDSEYFDKIQLKSIILSDDKMSVTKIKGKNWDNTNYGKQLILSTNKCIYKWNIKINKMKSNMFIGITTKTDTKHKYFSTNNNDKKFSYSYCLQNGFKMFKYISTQYGIKVNEGDILCLILNLNERIIKFIVNDKDLGIAFPGVIVNNDINYRLAISLQDKADSVTITKFQCIYPEDD